MNPRIHLTNWSSHRTPGAWGTGRVWTIMALPRRWEKGEGSVPLFIPEIEDLFARQGDKITLEEYRKRFLSTVVQRVRMGKVGGLQPGTLMARTTLGLFPVETGATLCCGCSVEDAHAGACHRSWAAAILSRLDWEVYLDGVLVTPGKADQLLGKA